MNFILKMSHRLNGWFVANAPVVTGEAPELQLQALEDRILYSAAPVPIELFADAPNVDSHIEYVEQQLEFLAEAVEELQHESTAASQYALNADELLFGPSDETLVELPQELELVVIDRSVDGHESLLSDILEHRNPELVSVHFIDSQIDGVKEISRILSEASQSGRNFSAVHIVSHGDTGEVRLGNTTLDNDSLEQYTDDITSWRDGLSADADILFYGCDLASDADGISLVDSISILSGADVAASVDVTGHDDQQGNWDLEYAVGSVDYGVVFSASLQESWEYSLQTTLGDEFGTSHKSIGADYEGNQTVVSSSDDSGKWKVLVSRLSAADPDVPLQYFDGSDFEDIQVNNNNGPGGGDHQHAVVGSAENGDFVVAWVWTNNGGSFTEVFAKVFDAQGNVIKDQFSVAASSVDSRNVTIAMNDQGGFAIAWEQFNGADNDVMVSTYDQLGNVLEQRVQVGDGSGVEHSNLVVGYNNQGVAALAYNGPDSDTIYGRALVGSVLSNEETFSSNGATSLRDFAIDINDQNMIGIAFVADVGPFGAENQDVYSILLQADVLAGTLTNVSPTTVITSGFGGISIQAFSHSGYDAGLEFAPSIAVANADTSGPLDETTFYVTWHGQGSWQGNLDAGTVIDGIAVPVFNASSFPSGDVVANNGVFISETTYVSDGSSTQVAEMSLQNELTDFDSNSRNTSVVMHKDRTEYAFVFESDTGTIVSETSIENHLPVALDSSMTGLENRSIPFRVVNFGFTDAENELLQTIRIESLPAIGNLTLFGAVLTQADIDATTDGIEVPVGSIGDLRYHGPDEVRGVAVANFMFSVHVGPDWSYAPAQMTLSLSAEDRLWLSTIGDSSATTSIPGDGSGTLQFGGPDVTFGDDTSGYWSNQFVPEGLTVDSVHYVNTSVVVGTVGSITLNPGDVLFSADSLAPAGPGPAGGVLTSLPSVSGTTIDVGKGDIIRFRSTSGDYSTGEYIVIANVEQMYAGAPVDYDINAFSLVEQDAVIGDRLVKAGDFMFSDSENINDIMLLELQEIGDASTGDISLLIEGNDVGISNEISGLEFIEAKTTAGGKALEAGTLLVSVAQAENVGSDQALAIEAQDIFALKVVSTTTSSPAVGTALMFFDGSDVGGDSVDLNTALDAVALLGSADPATLLVAEPENVTLEENGVWRFKSSDFVSDATAANLLSISVTSLPDSSNGKLLFRGEDVSVGQVVLAGDLNYLVYEPKLDLLVNSDSFGYRAVGDSQVLSESSISIVVTPTADDVLIGSGSSLHQVVGSDFDVNTSNDGDQTQQQIAPLADGGYVVAWRSVTATGEEVLIQRFDASHSKVGGESSFFDNSDANAKSLPAITGMSDGGFVVTASQFNGTDDDVWIARYNAAGDQVDLDTGLTLTPAQVFVAGGGSQYSGSIAELESGGLAIAYADNSFGKDVARVRVIHEGFSNDVAMSNSLAGVDYNEVTVMPLKQGGFVATWTADSFIGKTIEAQFFDVNGIATSGKVSLGAIGSVDSAASIAVLESNQTSVVWSELTPGDPSGENRIVGVLLNADGTIDGSGETNIVHNDTVGVVPTVVALPDGGFLVAVGDAEIDGSPQSIVSHRFDSQFGVIGESQLISTNSLGSQSSAALTVLQDSNEIVAVWNTDNAGPGLDIAGNAYLLEATAMTGDRISLDLTGEINTGASDNIVNVEISSLPVGSRLFGTETTSGDEVEIFGPVFNLNQVDIDSVELLLPNGVSDTEYQFAISIDDNGDGNTQTQTMAASTFGSGKTISGTVFNDENADGLIFDADGFSDVTVLLYEDVGGVINQILVATTDSDGYYEFTGVVEGTYFIAVDSGTIGTDVISNGANVSKAWAEQTYGGDGSLMGALDSVTRSAGFVFGGRDALVSDDASTLSTSEHVNRRILAVGDAESASVDFGFSFNVVTNVDDAFDSLNPDARTVQGSLRQFMANANYVDDSNEMKFVPAVLPNQSSDADNDLLTGDSWWRINVVDELPEIVSSDTILDGQAWTAQPGGLATLDYNSFTVRNSYTGTVGANDVLFMETDAPELELVGDASIEHGIRVSANSVNSSVTDVEINNFSIHGFGSGGSDAEIRIIGDHSGGPVELSDVLIQNNVIGSGPNDLATDVNSDTSIFRGIVIRGATDGLVSNNIIVGNTSDGIRLNGNIQASGWTISDNEIGGNARLSDNLDGINTINVSDLSIRRNAIYGNYGMGIDNYSTEFGSGNWTIEDNSIFDNGRGTDPEGSGIRLSGNDSVVRYNSIYENQFDGITVSGYFDGATEVFVPASGNLLSENSFEANGQLAIDLKVDLFDSLSFDFYDSNGSGIITFLESSGLLRDNFTYLSSLIDADFLLSTEEAAYYFQRSTALGDGIEFNVADGVANSNTANNGLDAPIIQSAEFDFGDLNLTFDLANADTDRVELYTTLPGDTDPESEAWQYFKTIALSAMTNEGGGIYSVTIPASDFPSGTPRDTSITALAIDGDDNTSEFGANVTPLVTNHAPIATSSTTATNEDQSLGFTIGDFNSSDPDLDTITDLIIISLPAPAEGQLLLSGSAVTLNQRIPVGSVSNLVFDPSIDYFGTATFNFAVSDGQLDSVSATMSVDVNSVSDAPTGVTQTVTIGEEAIISFSPSSFGFSDVDGDSFTGVRIMSFSGSGTLTTNAGAVSDGQFISAAELPELRYQPASNANGPGLSAIEFRVNDDGATASQDTTTRTLTYDVTPVSDTPTGVTQTVTINEDEVISFTPSSFGFSDVDSDTFAGVRIMSFTGSGTLTTDAGSVLAGQLITAAELSELRYQPASNENGPGLSSINFRVNDNGATDSEDTVTRTLTYDVTAVQDAPTGATQTITINEDEVVSFTLSSFGFSDVDGDSFTGVRIMSFSGSGTLTTNAGTVVAGQLITAAELSELRYQPASNDNGSSLSSIGFRVNDDGSTANQDTTTRALTYDVTPVQDAPTGVTQTLTINEDEVISFTPTSFGFSDVDSDSFAGVRIMSFSGSGTLTINAGTVVAGQLITAAELSELRYQPASNDNGTGLSSISFRVNDNGATDSEDTVTRTLTYDVTPIHDAPTGVTQTVTIDEDEVVSFTPSSFGFSDVDGDSFVAVRIMSFSGSGTLTTNAGAVSNGQYIGAAELAELRYQPGSDENGSGLSSIGFRVIDNGSTSIQDTTTRTLTYDVTPVQDAPTGVTQTVTINEDEVISFTPSSFGFSDAENDLFAGVRIMSFNGSGTLTTNAGTVVAGQLITAAELSELRYQPASNENGSALSSIDFRVNDNGATDNQDTVTRTLTYDVTPIHDAPTGVTQTVTIDEDEVVSFTPSSFGFSDVDGDSFAGVRIMSFSGSGTLTTNAGAVTNGQYIGAAELTELRYQPGSDENGSGLSSIGFRVNDDGATAIQDTTTRTLTYDVAPASDAPTGTSQTLTINEDQAVTFTPSSFGFSDAIDSDSDTFAGVRIMSFTGSGALTLNGVDVFDTQFIDAADLSQLLYRPGSDEYGNGLSTINFRVVDSGVTNNEGTSTESLEYNVFPVNDAPTGLNQTDLIDEDEVVSFTPSSFGFSDAIDNDTDSFAGVRIMSFSGSGRLTIDGIDVADGQIVLATDLSRLRFQPANGESGLGISSIDFRVIDNGSTNNEDTTTRTISYNVGAVNDAPTGVTQTVEIDEDESVTFTSASFGFSDILDSNADSFAGVRIMSFSGSGSLTLGGTEVVPGQLITAAELSGLRFQPAANENGIGLSSIDFRVVDSGTDNNEDTMTRTLTYDVASKNDAPAGVSRTISISEEQLVTFSPSTFGFSDPIDGGANSFSGVRIVSFSGSGSLTIDGFDVVPGDIINVSDLPRLQFVPGTNDSGSGISSIEFRVIDDGGTTPGEVNEDATTRTLNFDVANLNDAPSGATDTISVLEDVGTGFTAASFGFSDPNDVDQNSFSGVRIVAFSGSGRLTIDGLDVLPNAVMVAADLPRLQYTPGLNEYGSGLASIDFTLIDDGAVGAGHANEDATTRTLTFDVVPVNDQPTVADVSIVIDEEDSYPMSSVNFIVSDMADSPSPDNLKSIRLIDWSGQGQLTFDGVPFAKGTIINVADMGRLVYEAGSVSADSIGVINFSVIDDGGEDNFGVSESAASSITFQVQQINKAPVILSSSLDSFENRRSPLSVSFLDEDGDSVSLSFGGTGNDNALFEVMSNGKKIRFLDAPDFENPNSFSGRNVYKVELIATDANGNASTLSQVFVNVQNVVEAIDLNDDLIVDSGSGFGGVSLFSNDNHGAPMPSDATVSVLAQPDSGTVVINSDGTITYTPTSLVTATTTVGFSYIVERGGEFSTANVVLVPAGVPLVNDPNGNDPQQPTTVTSIPNTPDDNTSPLGQPQEGPPATTANTVPNESVTTITSIPSNYDSGADTLSSDISSYDSDGDSGILTLQSDYSTYIYASAVDTGLLTGEFASRIGATGRLGIQEFAGNAALAALFWQELDSANHDYFHTELGQFETMITVGALSFSGMAVTVIVRAALLGLSLGATYSQPWWMTSFDFLPIIDSADDESIEQIVDRDN